MAFWNRKQQPVKAAQITITDLDKWLGAMLNGGGAGAPGKSAYYKGIIEKIATTARTVPRRYTTLSGAEVAESDLPFRMNINNIIYQSSRTVKRYGRAYWGLDTQGSRIVRVRWFDPATITEDMFPGRGLVGFTRRNSATDLRPISYVYDPFTERVKFGENGGLGWCWSLGMNELGPGDTLDNDVELPAKLLQWADEMMAMLFRRGGINKWIAKTDHNPPEVEKDRIRASMTRLLGGGVENSSTFEVFSSMLDFQQIGTNPKDLEMEVVNSGNKADVSAAALTPRLLIEPDTASNRSVIDRVTASWLSDVVVPHTQLIVDALNHHIFEPSGYVMELQPDAMGANQEDEVMRAQAFNTYVAAGVDPETAAAMLGLNVPDDMPLMAEKETPPPITIMQQPQPEPLQLTAGNDDDDERREERQQFKRWYKKRGIGADVSKFTRHYIDDDDITAVIGEVLADGLWAEY